MLYSELCTSHLVHVGKEGIERQGDEDQKRADKQQSLLRVLNPRRMVVEQMLGKHVVVEHHVDLFRPELGRTGERRPVVWRRLLYA